MSYTISDNLLLRTPQFNFNKLNANCENLSFQGFEEALFLASPILFDQYKKWCSSEKKSLEEKVKFSLLKYIVRMHSRCTPFGLFAGCTPLQWSNEAEKVIIEPPLKYNRHTRLDMHFLCALAQELSKDPLITPHIIYYRNNSTYTLADKIRYVDYHYRNNTRLHFISSTDSNQYINTILKTAENGASYDQFAEILTNDGISSNQAKDYIDAIIDARLIVSELEPSVTGDEFIHQILSVLSKVKEKNPGKDISRIIQLLKAIDKGINQLDKSSANDVERYYEIIELVKQLGIPYDTKWLFQVDMVKSIKQGGLNNVYKKSLSRTMELFYHITPMTDQSNLENFKNTFHKRYGDASVPLQEVLDVETGIGFPEGQNQVSDVNPLLQNIYIPSTPQMQGFAWTEWQSFLHQKIVECYSTTKPVIQLDFKEITRRFTGTLNKKMPDSIAVMFSHLGSIDGKEKIHITSAGGSSAANLMSRFGHASESIKEIISDITAAEENLRSEEIIAEVVHLPESRVGNVLLRPAFRKYEIPYLAQSSVSKENEISLHDLSVSIERNEIVLWSKTHNKRIIPRLTCAHNFSMASSLPIYRFLCELQTQGEMSKFGFTWMGLDNIFTYLPRVEFENVVLSLASWRLQRKDFQHLLSISEEHLLPEIKLFRAKFKIPEKVSLIERDNSLIIDFTKISSVQMWLSIVKNRETIQLKEFLFNEDNSIVIDSEGHSYTNEFIAIFEKDINKKESVRAFKKPASTANVQKHFSLGSEWVYYKFYCGYKNADRLLTEILKPLTIQLNKEGLIHKWFFIRYTDPDMHLRVRFKLTHSNGLGQVIKLVNEYIHPFLNWGLIWKIQTDTYEREIQRYGANSIGLCENLFHLDSVCTVNMLDLIEGDEGEIIRWKFGIRAIDEFLDNFGYTLEKRERLMEMLKIGFGREFGMNRELKKQLDKEFRQQRSEIENILNHESDSKSEMLPLFNLLQERRANSKQAIEAILLLNEKEELQVPLDELLSSFIHMMLNRLFKSNQRMHEMIIYDFLFRHYKSAIAQRKSQEKLASKFHLKKLAQNYNRSH